jgi:hypothetical protein
MVTPGRVGQLADMQARAAGGRLPPAWPHNVDQFDYAGLRVQDADAATEAEAAYV